MADLYLWGDTTWRKHPDWVHSPLERAEEENDEGISLGNFDVVNDTGHTAHGFEIEIEDSSYDHPGVISSIFGLDRNFGVPAASVERYGAPSVEYIAGFGARITYRATFANGTWNVGTQSGVFNNAGDSCWTLGGVGYPNIPCDHFGIGTYGNPAKTSYSWLLETAPN